MSKQPISLADVLATFDRPWSPRIVTRVNDYDIRVAHFAGEHIWHVHEQTDEFFLVLTGEITIALRDPEERTVTLTQNEIFVVPQGTYHKPSSKEGATALLVEPAGTLSVGDNHEEVPPHIEETTGHPLP